jgi:hypothetical protein
LEWRYDVLNQDVWALQQQQVFTQAHSNGDKTNETVVEVSPSSSDSSHSSGSSGLPLLNNSGKDNIGYTLLDAGKATFFNGIIQ